MASSPQLSGQSMEILYRGTCRFVLFFFFFFVISFLNIFSKLLAIPILYQSKMLDGVSVGFPPLISKFILTKCTLKSRTCNGALLNFFLFFFLQFVFEYFFFRSFVPIPILYQPKKKSGEIFLYSSSCNITLAKVFFLLLATLPIKMHS